MSLNTRSLAILVLSCFFTFPALAEQVRLVCAGTEGGVGYADDSREFELVVDTKSGELYGFPVTAARGCGNDPSIEKKVKKDEGVYKLSCIKGGEFSMLSLTRQTGILEITTKVSGLENLIFGKYKCKKAGKAAF